MSVTYIENERITDAKRSTVTPYQQTASGYGSKLQTQYMVRVDGKRWHRIYCICYSNNGSLYVRVKGERLFIRDEYHIQELADRSN